MRFCTAAVHQDGDSAFGLTFPDLPGCFAAADAWEEMPAKAAEAMNLWFRDADDRAPRPLGEVRRMAEVEAALAEGAVLLTVPYVHPEGAQVRRMSRSAFLASLARKEITGCRGASREFADRKPTPDMTRQIAGGRSATSLEAASRSPTASTSAPTARFVRAQLGHGYSR